MRVRPTLIKAAVFATAISCGSSAALARGVYDGPWTVTMTTTRGGCSAFTSFGVQIINGVVQASGGGFSLRGRVSRNGGVIATAGSADQVAHAHGRLSWHSGGGSWMSPQKGCSGRWTATR